MGCQVLLRAPTEMTHQRNPEHHSCRIYHQPVGMKSTLAIPCQCSILDRTEQAGIGLSDPAAE